MEINEILSMFGINNPQKITQIYVSAWDIDDKYILKKINNFKQLEKSIWLTDKLRNDGLSVPEYYKTNTGGFYISNDDIYYILMKKMKGKQFDPYIGNPYSDGVMLGELVADLHKSFYKITSEIDCYDSEYMREFDTAVTKEIIPKKIPASQEMIDYGYSFEPLYKTLPRQLIHRDIHLGNMLFDGDEFVSYLDFDLYQKNVRVYDICYMRTSQLVDNYRDSDRVSIWREIFKGIVNGYDKTMKLTENERLAIPYLFVLIEVGFVGFFSETGRSDTAVSCMKMTEWFYQNRDLIKSTAEF